MEKLIFNNHMSMRKTTLLLAFIAFGFISKAQNKFKKVLITDTTVNVLALIKNDTLFIKTDMDTFIKSWNKQKSHPKFKYIVYEYNPNTLFFKNDYNGITYKINN